MLKTWTVRAVSCALIAGMLAAPLPYAKERTMAAAEASAAPATRIMLDGYPLPFPVAPRIVNGYTMVPFRAVAEALGIRVVWDAANKRVVADGKRQGSALRVVMPIGSRTATVNGAAVDMGTRPLQQNGTTLIPLGFFGRQFGAAVAWEPATRTVTVASPRTAMHLRAFYAIRSYSQLGRIPAFDSVAFGWMRVDEQGAITTQGRDFYWPEADGAVTPETIVAAAEADGADPQLMIYGEDGHGELTKLLQSPELRADAIASIVATAKSGGIGGVTLDFEGLGWSGDVQAARAELNGFVKELKKQTAASGLKLSLAVFPLNGSFKGYDYKTLGELADDLVIMAYNYGKAGVPEPVDKVDEAIRLALKQVPAGKLLLGIESNNETDASIGVKLGLAKRYALKGAAVWRLGLVSEAEYAAIGASVVRQGG